MGGSSTSPRGGSVRCSAGNAFGGEESTWQPKFSARLTLNRPLSSGSGTFFPNRSGRLTEPQSPLSSKDLSVQPTEVQGMEVASLALLWHSPSRLSRRSASTVSGRSGTSSGSHHLRHLRWGWALAFRSHGVRGLPAPKSGTWGTRLTCGRLRPAHRERCHDERGTVPNFPRLFPTDQWGTKRCDQTLALRSLGVRGLPGPQMRGTWGTHVWEICKA